MRKSHTQSNQVVNTFPNELEIIPNEIFLDIFRMLDMWYIEAVAGTCKRFRSIIELDKILFIDIIYTISSNGILNDERCVGNLEYPLKSLCLHLESLPRPKFSLAVQREEVKSSPGRHKKALLWIYEDKITYEALEAFNKSVSECPDASILLLRGDSIFSPYELPPVKQPGSVVSWKYLCISGGLLSAGWSELINGIEGLQWVYFKPGGSYIKVTTWIITTQKTVFIMESVTIEKVSGNIK
jgi:hypothetical protein